MPAEFVTAQLDAVFGDLDVKAVKIGMVAQSATIDAIEAALVRWSQAAVVLDPVMAASSGDALLAADAVASLRTKLMPRAALVTPNLPRPPPSWGRWSHPAKPRSRGRAGGYWRWAVRPY